MPTVAVSKRRLADLLGTKLCDEEFEKILFDFGLELDDVVEEEGEVVYKIEIPANRYDLLCVEGLSMALRAFLEIEVYEDVVIELGDMVVHRVGGDERPHVACAVIRDIDLSDERYRSFIEYQDKLHLTIGRNRMLSSVGTHDLDKIKMPVFYKSARPEDITFVPLNEGQEVNGKDLLCHFPAGSKVGRYMRLIENDEKYVFFEDSEGRMMSLPPVINADETKIGHDTRDVFVEVTGTDFHRVNTMLKLILSCFRGRRTESIRLVRGNEEVHTPLMHNRVFELDLDEVNHNLGLDMSVEVMRKYLTRMMYRVEVSGKQFKVQVHDVRSDVLHRCDIVEDIAIAHGFNNFKRLLPLSFTVGHENALNKFSDKIRTELAVMGFNEALTLTLLSPDENIVDGGCAVVLSNPKSAGYEVTRTSLIPGLMKFVASNLHAKAPFRVFEVADIVVLDEKNMFGARNSRRLAAVYAGTSAHLEDVQGPLSFLMEKCGLHNYSFHAFHDQRYLENQSAELRVGDVVLGSVGVCNPEICHLFKVPYASSFFEIDVEALFAVYRSK